MGNILILLIFFFLSHPSASPHQIQTQIIENELQALITITCPLIESFGLHSSIDAFKNYSLIQIEEKFNSFQNVNKDSRDWDYFYYIDFNINQTYESQLSFPLKHGATYTMTFYCDQAKEEKTFNTPLSNANITILSAKFKNSSNITTHIINHLLCALNEWGLSYGYSAFHPKYKGCRNEKTLARTVIKDNREEILLSVIPDWSKVTFDKAITHDDLMQIVKTISQLKSLEIYDQSNSWLELPTIKIDKIKPKSYTMTPSLSILIENTKNEGYAFLLVKKSADPPPSKEELINGSMSHYMKNNMRKSVEITNLIDFKKHSLFYVTSSPDPSPTGTKSSVIKALDFNTPPYYDLTFENSFISIKIWSTSLFNFYVGIGDENNQPPTSSSLMALQPKDGKNQKFAFIGQHLKSKKVSISEKDWIYEAFFYYTITELKKMVTLWFSSESSEEKISHGILHYNKESPKYEKMILTYDHSFNVDPTEYLGFKTFKMKSNVIGEIFAILIDNPNIRLIDKEFIKNAVGGQQTNEFRVMRAWNGNVTVNGVFEINYEEDENIGEEEEIEELKEETKYQLVFYGSSEQVLRETKIISRFFVTPQIAILSSCDEEEI